MEHITHDKHYDSLTDRYCAVKAGFVRQGIYLNTWCRLNGVAQQNVRKAFLGQWRGRTAQVLINRVIRASDNAD